MVYTPKPPCFQIQCFRDNFENCDFCVNFGKIGYMWFDENRARVMGFATFVTCICIALNIVAVCATSYNNTELKNTAWTVANVDGAGTIYIGLEKFLYENGDFKASAHWGNSCADLGISYGANEDYCTDCEDACTESVSVAIMSLITFIPTLTTDIQRSTRKGDMNCQKFLGVFTGILGSLSTIISLQSYADGCLHNLPNTLNGASVTYNAGPGFVCLIIATCLKAVDVVIMICTPVVPYEGEEKQDSEFNTAANAIHDNNL